MGLVHAPDPTPEPVPRIPSIRPLHAALLTLVASACGGSDAPRPNVVLVTMDTVRADFLSSYGYPVETTPVLDALAADGVLFERCMSASALTPVSHASILTGLYQYNHGLRVLNADRGFSLPEDVPTLATELGRAGWATGAFLSAYPVSERFGLNRGYDVFDNGLGVGEGADEGFGIDAPQALRQRRSDATSDAVIEWLGTVEEPFFLWIHYWDVHDPHLVPPPEAQRRFAEAARAAGMPPQMYAGELAYLDSQFGRVLDALRENGQYEDTAILVTSDHGEGLGEHDWHAHRLLYEEQIHVPLIARWPGGPRGVRVPELVRTVDIYPTVTDLLGAGPDERIDGRSLVGLAEGTDPEPRFAYADQLNLWDANAKMLEQRPNDDLLHCMMGQRWKLIYRPLRPEGSELYDLDADRDEARNLYGRFPRPTKALLDKLESEEPFVLEPFGTGNVDSEAAQALSELGYTSSEDE